ncbi:MAG: hypothetical protein LUI14_13430 [Lachnospiraceae bacterium]|nr:hypothetical protein [Lachnospiraceae bacterium]
MEYCKYIFSKVEGSDINAYSEFVTKDDFMKNVNDILAFREENSGVNKNNKGKNHDNKNNLILFNKLKELMRHNKILGSKKPDEDIQKFINHTRRIIRGENERIKRKEDLDEKELFELVNHVCIIVANVNLALKNDETTVPLNVYEFVAKEVFDYIRNIDHIKRNASSEMEWIVNTCITHTFLIPSILPMVVGVNGFEKNNAKDSSIIAAAFPVVTAVNANDKNNIKEFWTDMYLLYCIMATEIRMKEINERCGNDW